MRYQHLICNIFRLFLTQSNQKQVKHKPSHDLICIQIVDENLGRARNFEIFERSRDAGIERPQAVARINLESIDGNQANVAAIVLLEAGCVMRPVRVSLRSSSESVGSEIASKLISTYFQHGRIADRVSWDGADCCRHAREKPRSGQENTVRADFETGGHNLFGIEQGFVVLRPVIGEIKRRQIPLLYRLQRRLTDAICVDD